MRLELRPGVGLVRAAAALPANVLIGLGAAAESDLASRPSHHEADDDHEHDDFELPCQRAGTRTTPTGSAVAFEGRLRSATCCVSRGSLPCAAGRCVWFCRVGDRIQHYFDRAWRPDEVREGRLVVIGERGLDREDCRGPARLGIAALHLLKAQSATPEDAGEAIDLGQTPGDIVFLSAADTELACLAAAQARRPRCPEPAPRQSPAARPSDVGRPVEQVVSRARAGRVRLLGGRSYWPTVWSRSLRPVAPAAYSSPSCRATISPTRSCGLEHLAR